MITLKKSTIKNIPPRIVATLIFCNGLLNIVLSLFPTGLFKIPDVYEASQVFQYATDAAVLIRAGIKDAGYCICAQDDDAKNILITMVASAVVSCRSTKRKVNIVTLLDKPSNADNARKVGADDLIILPELASEHLLRERV